MRYWTGLVAVLLSTTALAGFGLPKLPVPVPGGDKIPVRIPGLDRILKEKPALTTSLDDAKLEVPYLDDFNPTQVAPLTEVPYDYQEGWPLVMGGVVEHWAQSYCLHAGRYGPGSGEGYLDARLSGPLAGMVEDVLAKSVQYLDLPQQQVQELVWSILARARVDDLSPDLRDVANKLLTPDQIRKLNGGALARIPAEVRDQVFGKLPPLARMALEAEASLRDLLLSHADFGALEEVAVLSGDPPPSKGDREVPEGRWSFAPEGYFVRYFPSGYSKTRIQLYVPERLEIVSDASGRLVSIADGQGHRIETEYAEGVEPVRVRGNSRVKAHAFSLLRLVTPGEDGTPQTWELKGRGWTFVGLPSGKGRPAEEVPGFEGFADRYHQAVKLAQQWRPLLDAVGDNLKLKHDCDYLTSGMEDLMDLAHYFAGLGAAVEEADDAPEWASEHLLLVKRAWMTTMGLIAQGPGEEEGAEGPWTQEVAQFDGPVLRLASLAGVSGLLREGRPRLQIAWRHRPFRRHKLPRFRPYRHGALPGFRGRQRLGQSGRSSSDSPGKQTFNRARKVLKHFGTGKLAVDVVLKGPAKTVRGKVGFAIPNAIFGHIISRDMEIAEEISRQLGGDPPRDDFKEILQPKVSQIPQLAPGPDVPAARAEAVNAFASALHDMVAKMRAAHVALDRFGGAMQAKDDHWVQVQATTATQQKRAVGQAMLLVASRLRSLLEELRSEGIEDIVVTPDAVRAYQQRLRAQGFSDVELQAAKIAGLTDEEIAASLQKRLAADPQEVAGSVMQEGEELVEAFEQLGRYLASMSPPSAFGAVAEEVR